MLATVKNLHLSLYACIFLTSKRKIDTIVMDKAFIGDMGDALMNLTLKKTYLQSVAKIIRKTAIWTIFIFSPLPSLKILRLNKKKTCLKLCYGFASYVMLRLNEQNLRQAILWICRLCYVETQ